MKFFSSGPTSKSEIDCKVTEANLKSSRVKQIDMASYSGQAASNSKSIGDN